MTTQPNGFKLPELSIFDEDTDLTIIGNDGKSFDHSPELPNSRVSGEDDRFLSKLANVCSESNTDSLVDNLVKQSCGIVGFGPMVSALERFRAEARLEP